MLGFEPSSRSGAQWYGSCPLPDAAAGRRHRSPSANVAIGRYCCDWCGSHGNPLELWAAATNRPLHQTAIDLCCRLGRDVPWIRRFYWPSPPSWRRGVPNVIHAPEGQEKRPPVLLLSPKLTSIIVISVLSIIVTSLNDRHTREVARSVRTIAEQWAPPTPVAA